MKSNPSLKNTSPLSTTVELVSIDDFEELIDFVLSLPYVETDVKYNVSISAVVENVARSLTQHPGFVLKQPVVELLGDGDVDMGAGLLDLLQSNEEALNEVKSVLKKYLPA